MPDHALFMSGSVQEVRIATRTGFCYGVREALDAALVAGSTGPTVTLGAIVHNEGANERLRAAGVGRIESLAEAAEGTTVVIRAHGVTPAVRAEATDRSLTVIDGTCSWVTAEHREMERLVDSGATIILLGTPGHPETVGLLGYAPAAIVVDEEAEWEEKIPRRKRMALISQSTQPPWKFERLAAFLAARDQYGLPGNDPSPAGHGGSRPLGRRDGGGRWEDECKHARACASLRGDRRAADPLYRLADRDRAAPRIF